MSLMTAALVMIMALAMTVCADEAAPAAPCRAVTDTTSLLSAIRDPAVGCAALGSGVYTMPVELKLYRSVKLIAQPGATPTISGARNGGSVTLSVGPEAHVELVGLGITGGNNTNTTHSESPECAGGVLNLGTLVMVDCNVYDNVGAFYGGGITNNGDLTMRNCSVHGNRFPHGCGLLPAPQGRDCVINRPVWQSSGEGGGIRSSMAYDLPIPVLTLIDSRVFNNTAGMGGGIVVVDSGVTLINSSVYNNTAAGDPSSSTRENYDGGQGGGILHNCQMACRRPNSTLINSSVFNNTASFGGGITLLAGSMNLSNSFVHNNKAHVADSGIRITILNNIEDHSTQDVLFLTHGSGAFDN